jgi:competence protein ComEC
VNSVLFTGDIERPVERQLLREGLLDAATVAMVPHHGSRTSSGADFIAGLRPQLAIVSSGYLNRWGFPKGDVVARWQAVGAEVLNTADSGAVTFSLCADGEVTDIGRARIDQRKFWNQKD